MDFSDDTNGVVESSAESPALAAAVEGAFPQSFPATTTKGHGLRRWRRIRRETPKEDSRSAASAAGGVSGGADEESAQLHKRRLPLAADAPKGKHDAVAEEESSVASVESRFIPPEPTAAPAKLDPNLGLLIASTGFSVGAGGADSDNSEDRSSKSSTTASAPRALPRHDFLLGCFARERDRARSRAPSTSLHSKNLRTARARGERVRAAITTSIDAENSRSSVESDLRSSNAAHARQSGVRMTSNGTHMVLFTDGDHSDEGQPSEEVRSTAGGYYKENGSVMGRLRQGSGDFHDDVEDTLDEGSVGKGENGGTDPYAESILLLRRTQEALENEIQKFVEIVKESSENFDDQDDETERSNSVNLEEPVEEASERLTHLESRLEEASALIKEKDSRILERKTLNQMQPEGSAVESTNLLSLQSDLEQLLKEKMEAEIQCIILTRAPQTWKPLTEDQMALHEAQKSLSVDFKLLGLKLRHAENRAMMLEEMAEKLEAQCKELAGSSEVLKLQPRASGLSLFCFLQLILMCIAVGTFLMPLLPSSTGTVPT